MIEEESILEEEIEKELLFQEEVNMFVWKDVEF
jgi:hypothetical protein